MDSRSVLQIVFLVMLLLLSALFSSSETALMSLSKIRVKHMLKEKIKGAELIYKLIDNPNRLLGTILVGNNIVNIAASAIATSLAIYYFGNKGVTIATIVMTLLVLVFAEITPKSLAAQHSEKVSLRVSKTIYKIMILLNPLTTMITYITNILIRILGGETEGRKALITEDELKTMINVSHEEGVLEVEERQMIQNVFDFGDSQVRTVMVPRTNACFINYKSSYKEVINLFKKEQFSRMPVYKDTYDQIIGVLHVKDLIFLENPDAFSMKKCMKDPYFTYEFKRTTEVFEEMRQNRIRMAIVLDEYGGTAGIVTIEDLVEEIVGEIEDEFDDHEEPIQVIQEDEYIVDGSTKIELINDLIGVNIESEDFDSIGGFIIGIIGRLPEVDETIELKNMTIIILKIDKNRIEKLKILT